LIRRFHLLGDRHPALRGKRPSQPGKIDRADLIGDRRSRRESRINYLELYGERGTMAPKEEVVCISPEATIDLCIKGADLPKNRWQKDAHHAQDRLDLLILATEKEM
jgi:hypothetical protein